MSWKESVKAWAWREWQPVRDALLAIAWIVLILLGIVGLFLIFSAPQWGAPLTLGNAVALYVLYEVCNSDSRR